MNLKIFSLFTISLITLISCSEYKDPSNDTLDIKEKITKNDSFEIRRKKNLNSANQLKFQTGKLRQNDKNTETYVKLHEHNELIKIVDNEWPEQDIEATYNIIKDSKNNVVAITEIPYSQSGDWSISVTHYFNEEGKTLLTERNISSFYADEENSVFKSGKLYHETLISYFDNKFNKIKQEYLLTDDKDRKLINPKGDNSNLLSDFKNYPNYSTLINSKKLKFTKSMSVSSEKIEDFYFPILDTDLYYNWDKISIIKRIRFEKEGSNYIEYSSNIYQSENVVANSITKLRVDKNKLLCLSEDNWSVATGEKTVINNPPKIIFKIPKKGHYTNWEVVLSKNEIHHYTAEWATDVFNGNNVEILKITRLPVLREKTYSRTISYYLKGIGLYRITTFNNDTGEEKTQFSLMSHD